MLLFWHPGAFSNPPLQITCSTEINVCAACVLRMCFACAASPVYGQLGSLLMDVRLQGGVLYSMCVMHLTAL